MIAAEPARTLIMSSAVTRPMRAAESVEAVPLQHAVHDADIGVANLNHGAQFLAEKRRQQFFRVVPGRSTIKPRRPAKAISQTVANSPPSERSW